MHPLLFALIVLSPHPSHNPLASIPSAISIAHGARNKLTLGPTGAGGPDFPLAFDAASLTVTRDRLKADRIAGMHAMGAGFVLTLSRF